MSAATSLSTRRRSSSPEPSNATMETESGTVMVARTGARVPPRGWTGVCGEALSWAAARAEAVRDALPSGTETPAEVSGKNPRPCLPALGIADRSSLPAGARANPRFAHAGERPHPRSAPRVGRFSRTVGQERRDAAAQVSSAEEGTGELGHERVGGSRTLTDRGRHQPLRGRVRERRAGGDAVGVLAGGG